MNGFFFGLPRPSARSLRLSKAAVTRLRETPLAKLCVKNLNYNCLRFGIGCVEGLEVFLLMKESTDKKIKLNNLTQTFAYLPIFGNFIKRLNKMKNTSISLGNYFDHFVSSQVAAGRYKNVSEVIRAGLRLLEDEESKTLALRKAIQIGLESPRVENFDFDENLKRLKAEKRKSE